MSNNSIYPDRGIVRPTSKLSFRIARATIAALLKLLVRLEIKGKENLPSSGPVIAVCNHLNNLDPLVHVVNIYPRDCMFMAKEELFKYWPMPLAPILMHIAEAFPVRRRGTVEERQEAIKKAEEVLVEGLVLGIYPEGKRSRKGQLESAHPGTAIIAMHTGASLIPVGTWGTEKLKGFGWLSRPRVTINFGEPFKLPILPVTEEELTRAQLMSLTTSIMERLAAVLPPEYRGKYGGQLSHTTEAIYASTN